MNKKFLITAFALIFAVTSLTAQTKKLSEPVKTETTKPDAPVANEQAQTLTTTGTAVKPVVLPTDAVASKFKSMYPSVQAVKWMQNKQSNYVAMYKIDGNDSRTVFKTDGTLVREISVIQQNALPVRVSDYLTKNFAGKTPKKCERLKNEKGEIIFIIKYDDKMVRLDTDGNVIKQIDEKEKSE